LYGTVVFALAIATILGNQQILTLPNIPGSNVVNFINQELFLWLTLQLSWLLWAAGFGFVCWLLLLFIDKTGLFNSVSHKNKKLNEFQQTAKPYSATNTLDQEFQKRVASPVQPQFQEPKAVSSSVFTPDFFEQTIPSERFTPPLHVPALIPEALPQTTKPNISLQQKPSQTVAQPTTPIINLGTMQPSHSTSPIAPIPNVVSPTIIQKIDPTQQLSNDYEQVQSITKDESMVLEQLKQMNSTQTRTTTIGSVAPKPMISTAPKKPVLVSPSRAGTLQL
jgi:hypothetical protein